MSVQRPRNVPGHVGLPAIPAKTTGPSVTVVLRPFMAVPQICVGRGRRLPSRGGAACGGVSLQRQTDATVFSASQAVPSNVNWIRSWSGQVPEPPQIVASVRVRTVSTGD
jgi:hypothetical protein